VLFPRRTREQRKRHVQRWSEKLLRVLGVRLHVQGKPARSRARPLVLVANHVSWVDIFLIDSIEPARFVAKAEVRSWPVVGWLCARVGTLFIDRTRRHDTARVNREVSGALCAGDVFAVFPEGTTTNGSTVLEFHASLLAPAADATADVQPVALRYERTDGTLCTEAAYDGERSVWDALMGITGQPEIVARLWFLEPIPTAEHHRRELAREAREAILLKLFREAPGSRIERAAGLRAAPR
jgi:1-acyl-sn-glycerol-3-phosphate acyltransferase